MNILLLGSGGREHALAWKLLQSPRLNHLYMNAQHAGFTQLSKTPQLAEKISQTTLNELNSHDIIEFSQQQKIDMVVIGPEAPTANGVSDALRHSGIAVFAPSYAAAQLETSKAFAKDFMTRHHIPTARYAVFSDFTNAKNYCEKINYPVVIKASGLASGKGVFLPENNHETLQILENLMVKKALGEAAHEIIIEERLIGEEISLLAFTDGITIRPMPFARDYKRLNDNNLGPNTGGMGAYAPVDLPQEHYSDWIHTILQPTIDGMRAEGNPYCGVIYAGLILTQEGPRVLEFNCRFGDPETQVLMPLLKTDLVQIMEACIHKQLADVHVHWHDKTAICVVLAAEGYPQKINNPGEMITGLDKQIENCFIFHAGTQLSNNKIITAGGRILNVVAMANDLTEAAKCAYQEINNIHYIGKYFRRDVGKSTRSENTKIDPYAAAGVDIHAGNQTINMITAAVKSTYGPEVLAGIGAFGGMYDASKLKNMDKPILVASTDGIGTKVHLAAQANQYESLGHDIVNHSVNDILVQGAKPLFFLDYVAASKLNPEQIALIVKGMSAACCDAGCALLGGETAEMPQVYAPNMIDVAGTIIGVVEKQFALPKQDKLMAGDKLIGIASSGPHTNGYSLIRKIFADVSLDTVFPELKLTLGEVLLAPHRSYLSVLQNLISHPSQPIKALIHITGGGFIENIPRVLSDNLTANIHKNAWTIPPLFQLIQKMGDISDTNMYRIFNMGIGMIMIVDTNDVAMTQKLLSEESWVIGELTTGNKTVVIND